MPVKKSQSQNNLRTSFEHPYALNSPSKAFIKLLKLCDEINPKSDPYALITHGSEVVSESEKVRDAIVVFHTKITQIPFLAIALLWASEIDGHLAFRERYIECITDLLHSRILLFDNKKSHRLLTLGELKLSDHADIFDAIRCYKKWSIDKQEEYVSIYGQFASWLSEVTFGLTMRPFDTDRQVTSCRRLSFDIYVKILKELSDREKILAKIFYLGGSRSLEEVLSLQVEDINFVESTINLSGDTISYPKHVLEDIKDYIGRRSKGYVFVGRTGDKIDHTVPYRALKTVTSKLDLDPSFTFKDFVKNI